MFRVSDPSHTGMVGLAVRELSHHFGRIWSELHQSFNDFRLQNTKRKEIRSQEHDKPPVFSSAQFFFSSLQKGRRKIVAMQPLARIVPRFALDSGSASVSRTLRIPHRPVVRPSICLQCRVRSSSLRFFADQPRSDGPIPPIPPNDSSPITLPPSQSESDHKPSEINSAHHNDNHNGTSEEELPSASDSRRHAMTKRFSHLMDHLQGNIFLASQRINDLTGYSGIEALKERISVLEARVAAAQEGVRSSRQQYKATVADRASTQREVTTLLARKDTWTPSDLERFTMLYRMDHSNEQAVQEAAQRLADAEREAEVAAGQLSSSILSRYHEEQIWSDKIRRMSTWGTWGLMGVNVLLFLVFQFGFEPWRRRRLVAGFEEKVMEALEKEKALGLISEKQEAEDGVQMLPIDLSETNIEKEGPVSETELNTDPVSAATASTISDDISSSTPSERVHEQEEEPEEAAAMETAESHIPTPSPSPTHMPFFKQPFDYKNIEAWKEAALDLWSSRQVSIRKQDLTVIALESAAVGAAVVGLIATSLIRRA
ncbi:sensitivity to high expression protein she9 [Clarireedia jacksonii]